MGNITPNNNNYEDNFYELEDSLPFDISVGDFKIKINHDLDYGFINDNLNY